MKKVSDLLQSIERFLDSEAPNTTFQQLLSGLGESIQNTSSLTSSIRIEILSNHTKFFPKFENVLQVSFSDNVMEKLRLLRGVVVLLRNLLVVQEISSPFIQDYEIFFEELVKLHQEVLNSLLRTCKSFEEQLDLKEFINKQMLPSYLQCLVNLSGNFNNCVITVINNGNKTYLPDTNADIKEITNGINKLLENNIITDANEVFLIYLNQLTLNHYQHFNLQLGQIDEDEQTNEFIYQLLNADGDLIPTLIEWFLKIDALLHDRKPENKIVDLDDLQEEELIIEDGEIKDSRFLILSSILKRVITHESFGKFIKKHEFIRRVLLLVGERLITGFQKMTNYQLIIVITWVHEIFIISTNEIFEYFENKTLFKDDYYFNVANLLQILIYLLTYYSEFTVKFLNDQKFLFKLINLLKLLHEKVPTISKLSDNKTIITNKSFPGVKKALVEAITFLVYQNFVNQESVRECGGLAVILSNCVIDKVNPYVKESCIVCIRYLLENNQKNQAFVEKLEAKKVLNNEELKKNGVEVEIREGKVQMKKK